MNLEHRSLHAVEIRVPDDGTRTFEAVVLRYGVVDDYETIFDAGCFTESLVARMPRITWAHDWSEPLGRYVDYRDTDDELTLIGEFDPFDDVPRARQGYAQLRSGTIDQFSVGFRRVATTVDEEGRTHFVKATLDEAALVIVGAVPGTKLVSVRSPAGGTRREVPEELVIDLAKKVAAKEITEQEAQIALGLAAGPDLTPTPESPVPDDGGDPVVGMEADEALATLGLD